MAEENEWYPALHVRFPKNYMGARATASCHQFVQGMGYRGIDQEWAIYRNGSCVANEICGATTTNGTGLEFDWQPVGDDHLVLRIRRTGGGVLATTVYVSLELLAVDMPDHELTIGDGPA